MVWQRPRTEANAELDGEAMGRPTYAASTRRNVFQWDRNATGPILPDVEPSTNDHPVVTLSTPTRG